MNLPTHHQPDMTNHRTIRTASARPLSASTPQATAPTLPQPLPVRMLHSAAATILQRSQERDTSQDGQAQERSMAATVAAFNAIEGTSLTERQGWAFMQFLKLARAANTARNGRYNPDDYLDGAAYAALGAEAAAGGAGNA